MIKVTSNCFAVRCSEREPCYPRFAVLLFQSPLPLRPACFFTKLKSSHSYVSRIHLYVLVCYSFVSACTRMYRVILVCYPNVTHSTWQLHTPYVRICKENICKNVFLFYLFCLAAITSTLKRI